MKERPILFSGAMVRSILAGRKTQTRRVVKMPRGWPEYSHCDPFAMPPAAWWWNGEHHRVGVRQECPCGQPGDRLWVRETFAIENTRDYEGDPGIDAPEGPVKFVGDDGDYRLIPRYRATAPDTQLMIAPSDADEIGMRWTPSIHMPRWASRILLEIVSVRIERLQDISEADAIAEGGTEALPGWWSHEGLQWNDPGPRDVFGGTAMDSYRILWESINGPGSWAANPWVWVIEFKRVEG